MKIQKCSQEFPTDISVDRGLFAESCNLVIIANNRTYNRHKVVPTFFFMSLLNWKEE